MFCRRDDCGLEEWGNGGVVRTNWIWLHFESSLGKCVRQGQRQCKGFDLHWKKGAFVHRCVLYLFIYILAYAFIC